MSWQQILLQAVLFESQMMFAHQCRIHRTKETALIFLIFRHCTRTDEVSLFGSDLQRSANFVFAERTFLKKCHSWARCVFCMYIHYIYSLLFLWQVPCDNRQHQEKAGSLEAFQSLVSAVKVIVSISLAGAV